MFVSFPFLFIYFFNLMRWTLTKAQSSFTVDYVFQTRGSFGTTLFQPLQLPAGAVMMMMMMIQPHFTTVDYFPSALEIANISIPLTPEPMKMTADDGWVQCGHQSYRRRQEHL